MIHMISIKGVMEPTDRILQIHLRDGVFTDRYIIEKGEYNNIKPEKLESKLLSTCATNILFRGYHFNKVEDFASNGGDCIHRRLEYHVCGMN